MNEKEITQKLAEAILEIVKNNNEITQNTQSKEYTKQIAENILNCINDNSRIDSLLNDLSASEIDKKNISEIILKLKAN